MRNRGRVIAFAAGALLVAEGRTAGAQPGGASGITLDARTRQPVADVRVEVLHTSALVLSDAGGRFEIAGIPHGPKIIRAAAAGYALLTRSIDIRPGVVETLELNLVPTALRLHEAVVVTARRDETSSFDAPRSTTVLTAATLVERLPRTTPEALMEAAGVWVQKTNHGGGSPFVRGLVGNQVLVLVDGIRLNNSTFRLGPNQYLSTVAPDPIERIEVVRGSGSVLYGSDALGGVVHILTKQPQFSFNGPKNGFMEAYAHYGKGLIIYNGFDNDQMNGAAYRQLVTRELAQPVNPSGLTCSARLGDFVITTDQRLKVQPMVPGRTYVYPLTLLANQGYSGSVKLSLASAPADPTFTYRFEPETVELTEISQVTLTLSTTRESSPALRMMSVRGTDAAGRSNALCLQLSERKTGGIQIVSVKPAETKPTRNFEIILDVSGSMKLALGAKTRWATALDVLKGVVEKLPDDFNVGLRAYAHRHPARSTQTCTDTELLLPIEKLDRSRILSAVGRLQPRGETPLIYSILQAPGDLKARGGGSVVVITDGEDTCKGDPIAAARQLEGSGLDVTLNIVGFTLKGKKVQEQLTTLAESTGGRYYGAQSGDALARALWIAAIDRIPYTIFDAAGKQVAKGDAGAPPQELDAGEYRVVVKAADQELSEQVIVTPASDAVLRVALKGDKFVIER